MPSHSRRMIIASLASAIAMPVFAQSQQAKKAEAKKAAAGEKVHCYGVNKCKGTGDCGGPGHTCAGKNSCKREGYIDMDKETCLRIDGGSLTPTAAKAAAKKK